VASWPRRQAAAAVAIGGRRAPAAVDRGEGSASTGEPTRVHGTDWLSSRRPKTAWPHEGGSAGTAMLAAATTGGNWPWRAPARGREAWRARWRALLGLRPNHQRERWCGHELCSLVHGGRPFARCACSEGEMQWAIGSGGMLWCCTDLPNARGSSKAGQRTWTRGGLVGDAARAWLPRHGARVGRLGILPNTCLASLCLTWRPFLGLLGSEFGYGPIMKVVHFMMPYNSCLRTLVIGAMD
jgi:hypothetical protein